MACKLISENKDFPKYFPQSKPAAASIGGTIYVFGGSLSGRCDSNELWKIEFTETFTSNSLSSTNIKNKITRIGPVENNNVLAVGLHLRKRAIITTCDVEGQIQGFNPPADCWPSPRHGCSLTAHKEGNFLLLFGGCCWACDGIYLNDLWKFDLSSEKWEFLGPFLQAGPIEMIRSNRLINFVLLMNSASLSGTWPAVRAAHGAAAVPGGKLLVYGGISKRDNNPHAHHTDGSTFHGDLWAWEGGSWTKYARSNKAVLPPRSLATLHVYSNIAWVFGGVSNWAGLRGKFEKISAEGKLIGFHLKTRKWIVRDIKKNAEQTPNIFTRMFHGSAIYGEWIVLVGGGASDVAINIATGDWRCLPQRFTLERHCMAVVQPSGLRIPYVAAIGGLKCRLVRREEAEDIPLKDFFDRVDKDDWIAVWRKVIVDDAATEATRKIFPVNFEPGGCSFLQIKSAESIKFVKSHLSFGDRYIDQLILSWL